MASAHRASHIKVQDSFVPDLTKVRTNWSDAVGPITAHGEEAFLQRMNTGPMESHFSHATAQIWHFLGM